MTEFVRICPRCSHINPEYENLCAECQQFIGMEPSVPRPATVAKEIPPAAEPVAEKPAVRTTTTMVAEAKRDTPASFYLSTGSLTLTIHDGAVIGQQHPGNRSAVQIPSDTVGCRYIHRQHCSFHYHDNAWHVQAIDQQIFGQSFTNPSWLNEERLVVSQQYRLQRGDILRLSAVTLTVDIP